MLRSFVKPAAILKQLKLAMPIEVTIEDPLTQQPIVVSYENLHSLLVLDVEHLTLEAQVLANLYAEMARLQRAFEFEGSKAEGRYRAWKAQMAEECEKVTPEKKTASGKRAAKQGPTVAEVEAYYRQHEDYEVMSSEPARLKAIAGFFDDLKWAFKMKSEMTSDQSKMVAGFERVARNEGAVEYRDNGAEDRLSAYENIAAEAARIAAESGSSGELADLLNQNPNDEKPKAPRALG